MAESVGHLTLIHTLKSLLKEAEEFEFHDFKNTKYPFPKMELHARLSAIMAHVVEGSFDD